MKITPQQIVSLFQTRPAQIVFRVDDIAQMTGVKRHLINRYITARPQIFPAGIGLDGKGCRREWLKDEALRVVQVMLNLSPKARGHVAAQGA